MTFEPTLYCTLPTVLCATAPSDYGRGGSAELRKPSVPAKRTAMWMQASSCATQEGTRLDERSSLPSKNFPCIEGFECCAKDMVENPLVGKTRKNGHVLKLVYFYGHAPNWSMVLLGRLVEAIRQSIAKIKILFILAISAMHRRPRPG